MKSNNELLNLGALIIEMRKKKGYSQRKFAQISGLSNTTISRIENNETLHPDIETLKLLAKHLDIDVDKLIKIVNSSKKQKLPVRHAKLIYCQKPVTKIKRYSSVFSNTNQPPELTEEKSNIQNYISKNDNKLPLKINLKGMRLITLRLEKNITQKELADTLGVDKTLISQYEGEIVKPDYETVERMAEYFGVTVEYLSGFAEQPKEFIVEDIVNTKAKQEDLKPEYIEIAKEIQSVGIDIQDVKAFINMIRKYKGKG